MTRTDEGYVLSTRPLGEADLIVALLGSGSGLVRGVAPSARGSRRRFGGALEPLTLVRAVWREKEGRDLHRFEMMEPLRSHAAVQSDPAGLAAGAVLVEAATALAREGQPEPLMVRLIGATLEALEGGLSPWAAVRYFEAWALRLHGVMPDTAACGICGEPFEPAAPRWVGEAGRILCGDCLRSTQAPARRLDDGARAFLVSAASRPPSDAGAHAAAARPGGALEALLRGGLEAFVERRLKTYRHLETCAR